MKLVWDQAAWDDYARWQTDNRKVVARIDALLTEVACNAQTGFGKPEPLRHGYWSRRITDEHRLIYKVVDDEVRIAACRYHYEP